LTQAQAALLELNLPKGVNLQWSMRLSSALIMFVLLIFEAMGCLKMKSMNPLFYDF
jgi:hypothetical protein